MSDREVVLGRVREALAGSDATPVEVPRDYRRAHIPAEEAVERFVDRVTDYKAEVVRVGLRTVADVVTEELSTRGVTSVVVPAGLDQHWRPVADSIDVVVDDPPLSVDALDSVGAVLTGCATAIAETGTIVLDSGPGTGRRAITLVPDVHLCVVDASQVVPDVPDAIARLDPRRPTTFISGPSATSDIELQRVEGVHGPRTLVVLLTGA